MADAVNALVIVGAPGCFAIVIVKGAAVPLPWLFAADTLAL